MKKLPSTSTSNPPQKTRLLWSIHNPLPSSPAHSTCNLCFAFTHSHIPLRHVATTATSSSTAGWCGRSFWPSPAHRPSQKSIRADTVDEHVFVSWEYVSLSHKRATELQMLRNAQGYIAIPLSELPSIRRKLLYIMLTARAYL